MPNGVSCAIFAARNHVYGKSEKNIFKRGIAGAQSIRTADAIAQSAASVNHVSKPVSSVLSKCAAVARKLCYPLIICSGVYNTVKSEDKVKTGFSQAAGIGAMYSCEKVTEKLLRNADNFLLKRGAISGSSKKKFAWYVAKGLTFVTASLLGYTLGSKVTGSVVDKVREKPEKVTVFYDCAELEQPKEITILCDNTKSEAPKKVYILNDYTESELFDDIIL